MKILICKWDSICEEDIELAFLKLGYQVSRLTRKIESVDYDKNYLLLLSEKMNNEKFDFVFSINYIPIISRVCNIYCTRYISWVVDSPLLQLYSNTIYNKWNRIFIFDKKLYEDFYFFNPEVFFYMPLATNSSYWDTIIVDNNDRKKFNSDISFVGSLYTEKCRYNGIEYLPDYLKGYVNGIIEAQLKVSGYSLIEGSLTKSFVSDFKRYAAWVPLAEDYREDEKAIVAQEYVGIKCSEIERIRLLNKLAEHNSVDIYTQSDTKDLIKVNDRGSASSRHDMPKIFKCSKINLNITSRTIRTGLSLRIFDIMGSGGFLLTNFQQELPDYFEIGKDMDVFFTQEDLIQKVDYYLKNDNKRKYIAQNGYEKVKMYHSYENRIKEMINMAFDYN